ncbi:nucleotide-diphospho-sugar transferase [Mycena sp. CBHHK59/15]|nr:nucleotide-diphospho-sugar transferase [Mycena sp. CBHHK59/15]
MASLSSRFFDRWFGAYERLPTDYSSSNSRRRNQSAVRIGLAVALSAGAVWAIWAIARGFPRRPYNPLDDYQNINPFPVTVSGAAKSPSRHAVVSSLYSDGFAIAVAVVGHSTRRANVTARLMLPYLEGQVSETALCITRVLGWETYAVPWIAPPKGGKGIHPRFKDQYTKLNIWALDKQDIDSAVYLDADTLVRRNFDELFDSPFGFAAVPDVYGAGDPRGFSLTLNAGVLAFHPSSLILADMRRKLEVAQYPLKQAEQAFLNLYFGGTTLRLPYVYNANLAIKARSPALWARLEDEMRIVHYTGVKPFIHEGRSSDALLTLAEVEEAMAQGARREGGFYAEEVAWWRREYRSMMREKGDGVKACYQASRTS